MNERETAAVHQAQLSEMELGEIVAYLQSIGYAVTVNAGDVPLSDDELAWDAEIRADIDRLGEREWIRKLSPGFAAELDAKDRVRDAAPSSAYVVPPSSTCQCYLCRARWSAVLETACE